LAHFNCARLELARCRQYRLSYDRCKLLSEMHTHSACVAPRMAAFPRCNDCVLGCAIFHRADALRIVRSWCDDHKSVLGISQGCSRRCQLSRPYASSTSQRYSQSCGFPEAPQAFPTSSLNDLSLNDLMVRSRQQLGALCICVVYISLEK
jgi:hypothetical protein